MVVLALFIVKISRHTNRNKYLHNVCRYLIGLNKVNWHKYIILASVYTRHVAGDFWQHYLLVVTSLMHKSTRPLYASFYS